MMEVDGKASVRDKCKRVKVMASCFGHVSAKAVLAHDLIERGRERESELFHVHRHSTQTESERNRKRSFQSKEQS